MATKKENRTVSKVTIEYSDGSKVDLQTWGLVGFNGSTWHSVLLSPAGEASMIKMNNMLVEISETLIRAINEQV